MNSHRIAPSLPDISIHEISIIYMENIITLLHKREFPDSIRIDGWKAVKASIELLSSENLMDILNHRYCQRDHTKCIRFWNELIDKLKSKRFPTPSEINEAEFYIKELSACKISFSVHY